MKRILVYGVVAMATTVLVLGAPIGLVNFGNSCYMNATAQLLYNMKDVVDTLLEGRVTQRTHAFGPTSVAEAAVDFCKAYRSKNSDLILQHTKILFNLIDAWLNAGQSMIFLEKLLQTPETALTPEFLTKKQNEIADTLNTLLTSSASVESKSEAMRRWELANKIIHDPVFDQLFRETHPQRALEHFISNYLITVYQAENCQQDAAAALAKIFEYLEPAMGGATFDNLVGLGLIDAIQRISTVTYGHQEYLAIVNLVAASGTLAELMTQAFTGYDRRQVIAALPEYITFNVARRAELTRFNNSYVAIPEVLMLEKQWLLSGLIAPTAYELIGVVRHSGSASGGHYTAYIKDQYDAAEPWYYCNDSSVEKLGSLSAQSTNNIARYSILLVYKKQKLPAFDPNLLKKFSQDFSVLADALMA